jgi:hypothetical protein
LANIFLPEEIGREVIPEKKKSIKRYRKKLEKKLKNMENLPAFDENFILWKKLKRKRSSHVSIYL